jgi:hypothetical protein
MIEDNKKFIVKKINLEKFSNFVIFQTKNGKVNIDVFFQNNTLWLTQKMIAELFEKGRSTITEHLKNIFENGELDEKVVCRDFRLNTEHGAIKNKKRYSALLRKFSPYLFYLSLLKDKLEY